MIQMRNRVRISKYVRSTNTWTEILDVNERSAPTRTCLMISLSSISNLRRQPKKLQSHSERSNKTSFLLSACGQHAIRHRLCITRPTIRSQTSLQQTHTSSDHKGLPYSVDFWIDERSDGIYVYSFVIEYTLNSDSTFASATLKIHRTARPTERRFDTEYSLRLSPQHQPKTYTPSPSLIHARFR